LAQQFGVSRTAVREAVKTLREKGLVEAHPGRGTFITNGSSHSMWHSLDRMIREGQPEAMVHLVEVREILEPEIAALAATRAGKDDIAAMREAFESMDNTKQEPEGFIESDLDFHLALAEAASNPLILSLIDSIVGVLREQRMGIFKVEGGAERGQYHHKKILDAVEHRDALGARESMRSHLQQVREDSMRSPRGGNSQFTKISL
jgi:GntR family transcriptional repressor for pyruvate dehydrogenase complex